MVNYRLKVKDYIYPREIPVRIVTVAAAVIVLALVMIINLYVGLFFLINIGLLLFFLYQSSINRMGYCVRVGPAQFPNIYNMAHIAAERLDIKMPPVYIQQSPTINAFASGFKGSYHVIITSAMLEGFTDEELLNVIGHEFSHIKGDHVIITSITENSVGLIKLVAWLQLIIKYIFLYLSRCQEFTCDRAALIASGNIQAFVTAFTKIAIGPELFKKIDMMEFYKQALVLDKNPLGIIGEVEATHPYTVNRIRQAIRFYRSDQYRQIAAMQGKNGTSTLQGAVGTGDLMEKIINKANKQNQGSQPVVNHAEQKSIGFCKKCGTPRVENAMFCRACGTPYEKNTNISYEQEEIHIPVVGVVEDIKETYEKICPNCGEKNNVEASFCNECGQKL